MNQDKIIIKGARENNLKNIDLEIPRGKLVVFTGLSGSGKSSLAFDTIYAEGQRRYVESLSAYARQFLGQMEKPDVDLITGLSPAISIDQKTTSRNPRSTVGTVTEIHDYLRLLYARVGHPHCPSCGRPITKQTVSQMVDQLMELPEGTKMQILGPLARGKKGEFKKVFEEIKRQGFLRVKIDGEVRELTDEIGLDKNKKHDIGVVVDRIIIRSGVENRLAESLELALKIGSGIAIADVFDQELIFSENFACPDCGISLEEIEPRLFSFNSPFGACPTCGGLGIHMKIDPELVVNKRLTLKEGALLTVPNSPGAWNDVLLKSVIESEGIDENIPFGELNEKQQKLLLYGAPNKDYQITYTAKSTGITRNYTGRWEGVVPQLERRYGQTASEDSRSYYESYMSATNCPACRGMRLKPEALAVTVGKKNIAAVSQMSVKECKRFFENVNLTERERFIGQQILKEINERLRFLDDVGLDYLTLSRSAGTLSGGEAQRIRLATQVGSGLVGVLYILDEPSIGLHQRDNHRLLATLKGLRDLGNTVIVVEHDEDTIREADYVVDIGPAAGSHGGEVVAAGTLEDILNTPESITGQYLSGAKAIRVPRERRTPNGKKLVIKGARENNLKDIDVEIPLNIFVCVTGVSGSGKSTLVNEILYKTLARDLNRATIKPGKHDKIEGLEYLKKVIEIDQSPIGRTPRSNPATYTGVFDQIRDVFAQTPEAQARGYQKGRFSFNVKGGRCEACSGDGIIKIEMHFLPDVYVPCEVCHGKRYNRETLQVRYKGKTIADVLDMRIDEAVEFFENIPSIKRKLSTLCDVGLGYMKLGQPATQLSGGEAQRVKLATELSRRSDGQTLYILDEPTTGLHVADIHKLLDVLQKLVEAGDTVLVIEHNLDVIKTADYIIDLGPEGGNEGGKVIASGTPEEVAEVEASYTGQYLKPILLKG